MEQTAQDLRIIAMAWWKELSISEQLGYFMEYDKFTPAKNPDELTGREIQNIWAVKTTPDDETETDVRKAAMLWWGKLSQQDMELYRTTFFEKSYELISGEMIEEIYLAEGEAQEKMKQLRKEVYAANWEDYRYLSADEQFHKGIEIGVEAGYKELESENKKLKQETEKVKRLLHDLTAGGSEFYNDPEYCAKWIREARQSNEMALKKIISELKKENEKLLQKLDNE